MPLHLAAVHDCPNVVKTLLDRGAEIEARDGTWTNTPGCACPFHLAFFLQLDNGWTPLHFAAAHNNPNIVEILLNSGADKDAQDST